jgi:hypothetical protein
MTTEYIMGLIQVDMDTSKAVQESNKLDKVLQTSANKAKKTTEQIAADAEKAAQRVANADKKRAASAEATANAVEKAKAKERVAAAQVEVEQAKGGNVQKRNEGIAVRASTRIQEAIIKSNDKTRQQAHQKEMQLERIRSRERVQSVDLEERKIRAVRMESARQLRKDEARLETISGRLAGAPDAVRQRVMSAIGGPAASALRRSTMAGGATLTDAFLAQVRPLIGDDANYLVTGRGRRPVGLGGTPPRPPRPPRNSFLGAAGGLLRGAGAALGIGAGAYAVGNVIRGGLEDVNRATAYDRQAVAAEKLAGSQAKLNALLLAYQEQSGGAVDKSVALANVTRLLATGYADTVPQVEKFVRATRGASIALGKPQDYVIQETQLAMSNTSFRRLDQIGLGIQEVNDRIERLRKTNADWTRETAFQGAVLEIMDEKYGGLTATVEGQATGVERLATAWTDLRLQMGQAAQGPVNSVSGWLANAMQEMTTKAQLRDKVLENLEKDPNWRPDINASETEMSLFNTALASRESDEFISKVWDEMLKSFLLGQGVPYTQRFQGPQFQGPIPSWMTSATGSAMPPPASLPLGGYSDDAANRIREAYAQQEEITRNYGKQIAQVTEQYESQRANTIRNYGKQMAREEEDFARQRARGLRDYERSIMDMMRDSQEREADWQEDLDEKVTDLREDANEKLADVEEKYQKEREKREEDHRDKLLKAAGQLDAIAILEERKRWKRENEEAEEAHSEQVKELKENLQEQIDEANEAHRERLEDAREADAKRLEDMRLNRQRQLEDENEDRRIRKERAAEDHGEQIAEMDRQHEATLQRLKEEAADARDALQDALEKDLAALNVYIEGYHAKMLERDKLIENWFDKVIERIEGDIRAESEGKYRTDENGKPVIPLYYGADLGHTPSSAVSSSAQSYSSTKYSNVVIEKGAISVSTTPGQEERVGFLVEEKMIELLGVV